MKKPDKLTIQKATFAGGCFWCMEKSFKELPGVLKVVSGYTGGRTEDPTYEEVCSGMTGHREAVQITYDPSQVTYEKLLDIFWRQIDPTDPGGQFADRGGQYTTAVYYHDEGQRRLAEASKKAPAVSKHFNKPIVTDILKASIFYKAEDYHQNYYKKDPDHYERYRFHSGRGPFLTKIWGDDESEEWV